MNIKSVQATQIVPGQLRSPEAGNAKTDAWTGLSPEISTRVASVLSTSINAAQTPVLEAQALSTHINYVKDQLDKILLDWPPFFPPGTYQRADLIKAIRNIQDEVEKSSVPSDMKKDVASQKLSGNATDHDISAALDKLLSFRDEIAKSASGNAEIFESGTVVSIRI
jgi:hypothetical protein